MKMKITGISVILLLGCAEICKSSLLTVTPSVKKVSVVEGATSGIGSVRFRVRNVSPFALEVFGALEGQIRNRGPDFGDRVQETSTFADNCIFLAPKLMPPGGTCTFSLGFFTPGVDAGEPPDSGVSDIFAVVSYCDPTLPPSTACLGRGKLASATGFTTVKVTDGCPAFWDVSATCSNPMPEPRSAVLVGISLGAALFLTQTRRSSCTLPFRFGAGFVNRRQGMVRRRKA